jgi:flavin reductase (DIM6/NTAB) family NADH-FMN oxidoreductase RutF
LSKELASQAKKWISSQETADIMNAFRSISPLEIPDNPFKLIAQDWMLITSGTPEKFNTMTASWGGLGELWFKKVCFCFVRPQRFTFDFMEENETFTLSFFAPEHRKTLQFCGANSGRNVDKAAQCGLTPAFGDGTVYFKEARLVLECRKLYDQDIDPTRFHDAEIAPKCYPQKDYHRMYIGEIENVLIGE